MEIEYEYVEPVRARGTLERELQAKHQAEELAARYLEHHSTEEESSQETKSGAAASAEKGKTKAAGNGSENGGSITRGESRPGALRKREKGISEEKRTWSHGGYRKKSENPDVLYGRDFEAILLSWNELREKSEKFYHPWQNP